MAHVHGEYLEEGGEEDVELDMVVEEETPNTDIEVILPDTISDEVREKSKEFETGKVSRRLEFKTVDKKTGKVLVSSIYEQKDTYILE